MKLDYKIIFRVFFYSVLLYFNITLLSAQDERVSSNDTENVRAKGAVINENGIKLRWSPSNPKAWADGQKEYGYTIERYAMVIDNIWPDNPPKLILREAVKPAPLEKWETLVNSSDYAAVIAQAFYGDEFSLGSSSTTDIATIINQSEELQQRFSTSVFMAEYDYKAAEMAGWAFTDSTIKKNEKYLYRIILDRPDKIKGDTALVFIGYNNKIELPKPYEFSAVFGDKSVMLSWDCHFLADTYHSYYVEKKSSTDNTFRQITDIPVTPLDTEMREFFYTDSLTDNETTYTYRIKGITSFGEIGPVSDSISGHGIKTVKCVPHISAGYFNNDDLAQIYWEFNCDDEYLVKNLRIDRSETIDGDYATVVDDLPIREKEHIFTLIENENYVKLLAINKDGSKQESFPFLLRRVDSIPPAVPIGLKAEVDSLGVAHISWNANVETDLRGYRLLRSFVKGDEKSSLISDFITATEYTDSLSLTLNNPKVYYSLTAVDNRYNESEACLDIEVDKPTMATPANPVIVGYETEDNRVTISWIVDRKRRDTKYTLTRNKEGDEASEIIVFSGDSETNSFTDEISETGDYVYKIVASYPSGLKSISPQPLNIHLIVDGDLNQVAGFNSYVDRDHNYVELTWRKNDKASRYRIYKSEGDSKMFLWQELDATQSRVVDEQVSPNANYTYTILFITSEGRPSKARNLIVNY